jgi:hydrogenase assembly chaperone HypC/HupF
MSECVADHGCITCGDVAIPMRIAKIDPKRSLALCESVDGQRESVEIALVEPVRGGEWLLVHAGTALARAARAEVAAAADARRTVAGEAPERAVA